MGGALAAARPFAATPTRAGKGISGGSGRTGHGMNQMSAKTLSRFLTIVRSLGALLGVIVEAGA